MNEYEDVLKKNGVLSFTPGGNSMWPIIRNKDATVIIGIPHGRLHKFDVAFYRRDNSQAVLHRVIKVNGESYDMCGDSQLSIERGVKDDAVFGILEGFYQDGKYIDCKKNSSYKLRVRLWSSSMFIRHIFLKAVNICGKFPKRENER